MSNSTALVQPNLGPNGVAAPKTLKEQCEDLAKSEDEARMAAAIANFNNQINSPAAQRGGARQRGGFIFTLLYNTICVLLWPITASLADVANKANWNQTGVEYHAKSTTNFLKKVGGVGLWFFLIILASAITDPAGTAVTLGMRGGATSPATMDVGKLWAQAQAQAAKADDREIEESLGTFVGLIGRTNVEKNENPRQSIYDFLKDTVDWAFGKGTPKPVLLATPPPELKSTALVVAAIKQNAAKIPKGRKTGRRGKRGGFRRKTRKAYSFF